jgi:hypothetical protein
MESPVPAGHRTRARLLACLGFAAIALAGCGPTTTHGLRTDSPHPAPTGNLSVPPAPPAGSCHVRTDNGQPLPDASCTPGATNRDVTEANLNETVCRSGWTKTVRPPASYTDALKREQITAYGYTDTNPRSYEEDHLISLEIGGAPADPHNLWPEPGASPNAKDPIENQLNTALCGGLVHLADVQHAIATDWTTAMATLGLQARGNQVCLIANPSRCAANRHAEGN